MGIFVDDHGKLKSSLVIKGFSLSFLFIAIYVLGYVLSANLLVHLFPAETGGFFAVWGPPALISLVCSLLCCSLMILFKEKIIVPIAFLFITLFYIIFIISSLIHNDAEIRGLGVRMVSIYALPAMLLGNFSSWEIFCLYRHSFKNRAIRRI